MLESSVLSDTDLVWTQLELCLVCHLKDQYSFPTSRLDLICIAETVDSVSPEVTFEDVIAEPPSVRSFDKVWLWSHALFEVSRLWCYRLISLLLALPVSLVAGILFAVLSCLHIWWLFLINMHWVQTVWGSVLDIAIAPFFKSMGKCCGRINIRLARD
uniref:Caveolin n=1 Tax=Hucho hucho TaxID=62062 RepID=A0A4W5R469_9TELE